MQTPPHTEPSPVPPAAKTAVVRNRHIRSAKWLAALLALGMIALLLLRARWEVEGPSMEPALPQGTTMFVVPTWLRAVRLGDVVVVRSPADGYTIAKRVIGLGGDRIAFTEEGAVRNGAPLATAAGRTFARHEEYEHATLQCVRERVGDASFWTIEDVVSPPFITEERAVPAGHVYLAGDHRDRSNDSRFFGAIPIANVVGVVVHVFGDPPDPCR